ncbi:hypothetical protein ACFLXU_03790 [Chloroflexota bacterium]
MELSRRDFTSYLYSCPRFEQHLLATNPAIASLCSRKQVSML